MDVMRLYAVVAICLVYNDEMSKYLSTPATHACNHVDPTLQSEPNARLQAYMRIRPSLHLAVTLLQTRGVLTSQCFALSTNSGVLYAQ